jgi:hypothetical protein
MSFRCRGVFIVQLLLLLLLAGGSFHATVSKFIDG